MFRIMKKSFPNDEMMWATDTEQEAIDIMVFLQQINPKATLCIEKFNYSPEFSDVILGGDER